MLWVAVKVLNKRPKDLKELSSLELEWMFKNYFKDREEILEIVRNYFQVLIDVIVKLIGAMNGIDVNTEEKKDMKEEGKINIDLDLFESLKEEGLSLKEVKKILVSEDFEYYKIYIEKGLEGIMELLEDNNGKEV